jgi:hypothetical protein
MAKTAALPRSSMTMLYALPACSSSHHLLNSLYLDVFDFHSSGTASKPFCEWTSEISGLDVQLHAHTGAHTYAHALTHTQHTCTHALSHTQTHTQTHTKETGISPCILSCSIQTKGSAGAQMQDLAKKTHRGGIRQKSMFLHSSGKFTRHFIE